MRPRARGRTSWSALVGALLLCLVSSPVGARAQTGNASGGDARDGSGATGFALRGGTLGPGLEVARQITPLFAVRVGGTYLSVTDQKHSVSADPVDVDLSVDAKFTSFYALADIMPFGSFFHFVGGIVYNAMEFRAVGNAAESYTLGSRTFTPTDVGSIAGSVSFDRKVAPYVGVALGNVAVGRRVGLTLDAGVVYSGPMTVTASGSGMLTPSLEQLPTVQDALDGVKIYPVVSFGLAIRP